MTVVLCLSLWIIQATHEEIAKLTYLACGADRKLPPMYDLVRLALCMEISAWMFGFDMNGFFVALSAIALTRKIYEQQKEFATLDRASKGKKKMIAPLYIDGAGPSQSAWANDPKVLEWIPRWINSRHLTCMTLVEVSFLLYACAIQPEDGAVFMASMMWCHYLTDALDGGLGRYRKEGYRLWGGYCDHLFDALYETACMLALWMMIRHEKSPLGSYVDYLGPICLILMNIFVLCFHKKETVSFEKKLATHYSNLVAGIPLHYIEWGCIIYLLVMHVRRYSPTWNACLVVVWLSGGILALGIWHIKARRIPIK
jgi:phosphatidylglycerophosphate synthase